MSFVPLGKETVVRALGRSWTVGRWTIDVWDNLLTWAKPRLPDPFAGLEKLIDKVPAELAEKLISQAQSKAQALASIMSPEVQHLLDETLEGRVQVLYELVRQHHPELTRDDAFAILREMGESTRQDALLKAQGDPPSSGNESAPAA